MVKKTKQSNHFSIIITTDSNLKELNFIYKSEKIDRNESIEEVKSECRTIVKLFSSYNPNYIRITDIFTHVNILSKSL